MGVRYGHEVWGMGGRDGREGGAGGEGDGSGVWVGGERDRASDG